MTNYQSEFQRIADDLTNLFKDEIKRQGLVETGKLLNSIRFTAREKTGGWEIVMVAEDYFTFLDEKYHISRNVYASMGYQNTQKQIANVYNLMLLDVINLN